LRGKPNSWAIERPVPAPGDARAVECGPDRQRGSMSGPGAPSWADLSGPFGGGGGLGIGAVGRWRAQSQQITRRHDMGSDDDDKRRARAHGNRLGQRRSMAGVGCGCPSRASAARRTLYGTAPCGAGRTGGWAGHRSAERLTHTRDVSPTAQPVGPDHRPGPLPRGDSGGGRCQLIRDHPGQHMLQRTRQRVAWPIDADPQMRPAWAPSFPRDET
jgi:hypothetical protein